MPSIDAIIARLEAAHIAIASTDPLTIKTGGASNHLHALAVGGGSAKLAYFLERCQAAGIAPPNGFQVQQRKPATLFIFWRTLTSSPSEVLDDHLSLIGARGEVGMWPAPGFDAPMGHIEAIPFVPPAEHEAFLAVCRNGASNKPEPPLEPHQGEDNLIPFHQPKTSRIAIPAPVAGLTSGTLALASDGRGPLGNLDNALGVLETSEPWASELWYDSFADRIMFHDREWIETDDLDLTRHMQRRCAIERMNDATVRKAVTAYSWQRRRNPVQDWLNALEWDQTERIQDVFPDHFGSKRTTYTRAASKNFFLSLVARALNPGCQVDTMIVLEGNQGIGKSQALHVLAEPWFAEQHNSVQDVRSFAEILQGKWLIEIAELDAFSRAEITRVKSIITSQRDRYRAPYQHYAVDHPRSCVFVGTTNRDDWNKDETGARRFWPIACTGDIDLESIRTHREQFFAEALALFRAGESWWTMPAGETAAEQDERYATDTWEDAITEWLGFRASVTTREIGIDCLKFDSDAAIGQPDVVRISKCLRRMGWVRRRAESDGRREWRWYRA